MTSEQAAEFQAFLIEEMHRYGFGSVADEASLALKEEHEQVTDLNSVQRLANFIKYCIETLDHTSNKDFDGLLGRLNEFSAPDDRINSIAVVEGPGFDGPEVDLRDLPDYRAIAETFSEVLVLIEESQ